MKRLLLVFACYQVERKFLTQLAGRKSGRDVDHEQVHDCRKKQDEA